MSAARARILAGRYPQSAEVLDLVAAAWEWMGESRPALEQVQPLAEKLCSAMRDRAPEPLRDAVPDAEAYLNLPDPYAPSSFFARIVLEAWARHAPLETPDSGPSECPRCGHAPQLGVLRPSGNGDALFLSCSLCRHEWPYRRTTCPECGETDPEKISFHQAEGWPQAQTQTCSTCQAYFHLLAPEKDLGMVPEIDELALLPLDVWATEQGFHKVWPNLAGL